MDGFIMDFLKGNIEPQDRPVLDYVKRDTINTEIEKQEAYLKEHLSDAAKERFEAYVKAANRKLILADNRAFCAGFRLGAKCMIDVLQE